MKKIICLGITIVSLIVILVIAFSRSSKDYKYIVKFNDNFGDLYKVVYVEEDGIVPIQSAPSYFIYEFDYWYDMDSHNIEPFDFEKPIDSNITLNSKYTLTTTLSEYIEIDEIIYECFPNGEAYVHKIKTDKVNVTILDEVTIDNKKYSVKYIGFNLFENKTFVESIVIPDSVTHIFSYAFTRCTSLKSINLPKNLIYLGSSLFEGCTSLENITIPSGVHSVPDFSFYDCTSLKNVTLSKGVKYIDSYAFDGCSSLSSITLPNTIEYIGKWSFAYCSSLEEINLPKNLYYIGYASFKNCNSLTNIELNENLTFIERNVFADCATLSDIKVSSKNKYYKSIDGNIYTKDETEFILYAVGKNESSFVIPKSVKVIRTGSFNDANNLSEVILSSNIEEICSEAFSLCSRLKSINIPSSVTSIGEFAFLDCVSLTIYTQYTSAPSGWSAFWNVTNCPVVWGYEGQ